jgi:hypothetical protein
MLRQRELLHWLLPIHIFKFVPLESGLERISKRVWRLDSSCAPAGIRMAQLADKIVLQQASHSVPT